MSEEDDIQDPTRHLQPTSVPPALASHWAGASELAFGSAVADPRRYQATTRTVAALVESLSTRGPGIAPLLAAWDARHAILAEVVSTNPAATVDGLDPEMVAGAAFALRHRAAAEEQARIERAGILARSTAHEAWIVLEESGYEPGDPFAPYRRLEVHAASRTAVLVTTRPDEALTACIHSVQRLGIDPATGQLFAPDDGDSADYCDAQGREKAVLDIHAEVARDNNT